MRDGCPVELRQLEIFEAVAEAESFTAAAERLGYVQSSVSANILALERELGVPLFDRLGRRVRLTDAGLKLLPYARQMRQVVRAAKSAATDDTPGGRLAVGACESPGTYRLPRLLALMRERYPAIDMHVSVPLTGEERRAALRSGQIDVAMALDEQDDPDEFEVWELRREPIHLIFPPNHPLAQKPEWPPSEWATYPYLATESGGYRARFEAYLARNGVTKAPVIELGSVELIKQCVMAGLGYGVLPVMTVEQEVAHGLLVTRPWPASSEFMSLWLVRYKDRWMGPALAAFWETAIEWAGAFSEADRLIGRRTV